MFIAPTLRNIYRGSDERTIKCSIQIQEPCPLVRTAMILCGVSGYKYVTPSGVKNESVIFSSSTVPTFELN